MIFFARCSLTLSRRTPTLPAGIITPISIICQVYFIIWSLIVAAGFGCYGYRLWTKLEPHHKPRLRRLFSTMMIACFLLLLLCVLSILGLTVCTPERPVEYFVFSVLSAAVTITEFVTAVVGVAPPQAFSVDGWNSVFGCKRSKVYVEGGGGGGELGTGEYNPNSLMVRRLKRRKRR